MSDERVLEVEHLTVRYADANVFGRGTRYEAVHDVSFYVNHGEIVGLVGESGCGKSTLSKAILGMLGRWGGYWKSPCASSASMTPPSGAAGWRTCWSGWGWRKVM